MPRNLGFKRAAILIVGSFNKEPETFKKGKQKGPTGRPSGFRRGLGLRVLGSRVRGFRV